MMSHFLMPCRKISETDPAYWNTAYQLLMQPMLAGNGSATGEATASGGCAPAPSPAACPSYLQPLVGDILTAGKSLRLLKSSERNGGPGPKQEKQLPGGGSPQRTPRRPESSTSQVDKGDNDDKTVTCAFDIAL